MKLIVTGGAGFIGSAAVRHFVAQPRTSVINVDKLTYAASMESLVNIAEAPNYTFERADICDRQAMARIFQRHRPDAIMHLAAETHVDRSIDGAGGFVTTNIHGTHVLLEVAQDYWSQLEGAARTEFRFHHVSTDEVFGTLGASGTFTEASAYAPSSPYAASKAASDHLVRAWHRTYGLPTLISNCSNNYGSHQFPEKLIPLTIVNALEGRRLPVYGRGHNVRDWLYVDDHVDALERVLRRGTPGESYNIGGCAERRNIDVVKAICALLDELRPDERRRPRCELIELVADRPGHDFRYALAIDKIARELGWRPRASFESGLRRTVAWYLDNPLWWQRIRSGLYGGERLGAGELGSVAYA